MKKILLEILCTVAGLAAVITPSHAWPTRPLTIVLPSTPGAALDQIARDIQSQLPSKLGVPVVIVYKPGGNAKIGTKFVAQATDDHTVLLIPGQITINTILDPNGDHMSDLLRPVSILAVSPSIVTTAADSKIIDGKQMLQLTSLSTGAAGGTISEYLIRATNKNWTYVAYKGGVPMFVDVMARHVDVGSNSTMGSYSYIRSGKLRPVMVFSRERLSQLPEVPTSIELGVPFAGEVWFGVLAPKNMANDNITKLSNALISVATDAAFKNKLINQGAIVLALNPAESQHYLDRDLKNLTEILKGIDK
jgi:tripartite-type tricarboxylate transporter receptor subunit TctC